MSSQAYLHVQLQSHAQCIHTRSGGLPFVECLDRMPFWTAADLERKLVECQQYSNEPRTPAGRRGRPPAPSHGPAGGRASSGVSVAAPLPWAVSHAEAR
jgi:hypothetical protein